MEKKNLPQKTIEENGKLFNGKGFIETPIEYLERLLLNHEILVEGYLAFICIHDEFQGISTEYRDETSINDYIERTRPGALEQIDSVRKDIENLKLEIEAEKTFPSDVSMEIRLHNRLGHL
ncbi:MAG: hypothetical protein K0M40_22715 [Prolixibacteraceae bacterium]|nr:hypothetical protein [Prolixibacteraceae bacterium]